MKCTAPTTDQCTDHCSLTTALFTAKIADPCSSLYRSPTTALFIAELSTKFCDNGFCVDLGYFGATQNLSGEDRFLLELEDWITAGQVSAGAGVEARGDWFGGKWKEVLVLV